MPRCLIIAGPNGAGKTTFALKYLIPTADIERCFPRGLRNLLNNYRMRVDKCVCYMNDDGRADKIFEQAGDDVVIADELLFAHINRLAGLRDE